MALVLSWFGVKLHDQLLGNALTKQQHYNTVIRHHVTQEIKRLTTLLENKSDPMAYTLSHNRDIKLLEELLNRVMSREKAVHVLMILQPDGKIITGLDMHEQEQNQQNKHVELIKHWKPVANVPMPEISVPMQGNVYIGDIQKTAEGLFLNIAVPVGPLHKPLAVLFASIDTGILWGELTKEFRDKDVTSYIIDRHGVLLSSINNINYKPGENVDGLDVVRSFIDNSRWEQMKVYQGISGNNVFGTLDTIEIVNWGVISEVGQNYLTTPINRSLTNFAIAFFVLTFIFLVIGFGLVRRITRPIHAICNDFTRVAKQNYLPSCLNSPVMEIQTMVSGFNRMVREIGDSHEKLQQAAVVFRSTAEGVMITDPQSRIVAINNAFTKITGYSEEDVKGKKSSLLNSGRHEKNFFEDIQATVETEGEWQGEVWNRKKSGEIYPVWLTINIVRNNTNEATHFVGVFTDITVIKKSEAKLAYLAHHDPLTGLPNRLLLNSSLDQAIKRAHRNKRKVAVLFLDLDRFKNVNDSMGHPQGDRLLETVANRLTSNMREGDMIARLGGDEFIIIVDYIDDISHIMRVAESTLSMFDSPFYIDEHEVYINASIGVSIYPKDGNDVETMIRNADAAMYRAKEQGRNNYQFYTEELTTQAYERLSLETRLRHALERDELVLHYQPQVSLRTGRLIGIEALLRWNHPELGMVSPAKFIPIAEETGLIIPIGEWVLQTACAQNQAWIESGFAPVNMAVNLSARQFHTHSLAQVISKILQATGMKAQYLELELTESIVMHNSDDAIRMMGELSEMEVKLAIDDFGTGYSSLSYMQQFPIDKLKIDQSFVRNIGLSQKHNNKEIVVSIITLGHSMNLRVIAEGVETIEQLEYLKAHNCDEVQGYYYGYPVSPEEFTEFFNREFLKASLKSVK